MSTVIPDYSVYASSIVRELDDLPKPALLFIALACCRKCASVWMDFDGKGEEVFDSLAVLEQCQTADVPISMSEVLLHQQKLDSCVERAADAEGIWSPSLETEGDRLGLLAYRAGMAASALSNLCSLVLEEDEPVIPATYAIALSWVALGFTDDEKSWQLKFFRDTRRKLNEDGTDKTEQR